jgi:hypothetical protein
MPQICWHQCVPHLQLQMSLVLNVLYLQIAKFCIIICMKLQVLLTWLLHYFCLLIPNEFCSVAYKVC